MSTAKANPPPPASNPVSLIPRNAKATRKKRPGFRPVSKSGHHRSAVAIASQVAAAAAAASHKGTTGTLENSASTKTSASKDHPTTAPQLDLRNVPTREDSNLATASVAAPDARYDEDELTLPPVATADQSPLKDSDNSASDGVGGTSPVKATIASASSPKVSISTSSSLKRKLPARGRIQIGATRQLISKSSSLGSNRKSISIKPHTTAIVAGNLNMDPGDERDSFYPPQQHPQQMETNFTREAMTPSKDENDSALVAVSQDKDILERLTAESTEGARLSVFCSKFKSIKLPTTSSNNKHDKKAPKRRRKNDPMGVGASASGTSQDITGHNNNHGTCSTLAEGGSPSSSTPATSTGVPVVQIVDGEIVVVESSLVLPTRRSVQEVEEEFQGNVVEEDAQLAIVGASYTSFVTKRGGSGGNCTGEFGSNRGAQHWSLEETQKFYDALRMLGTDFGSMEAYFDGKRTRRQLKHKYRKELIKNANLVEELALNPRYKTEIDLSAFNVQVDPKRIEAHENEEPPPHEPTDVDGKQPGERDSTRSKLALNLCEYLSSMGDRKVANNLDPMEDDKVVEENAYDDHRAEAGTASGEATEPQRSSVIPTHQQENAARNKIASLWPAEEVTYDNCENLDSGVGILSDNEKQQPTMEEFFSDQYDIPIGDDGEEDRMDQESTPMDTKILPSTPKPFEPSAQQEKDTQQVSLIPRKAPAKSKRPKIRPSARKKKM